MRYARLEPRALPAVHSLFTRRMAEQALYGQSTQNIKLNNSNELGLCKAINLQIPTELISGAQTLRDAHDTEGGAGTILRKNFFLLRVMEPWPRLPREAVESPSLEIFQTHLDAVLCSLLRQGVGLGDPQRALPTPTIL